MSTRGCLWLATVCGALWTPCDAAAQDAAPAGEPVAEAPAGETPTAPSEEPAPEPAPSEASTAEQPEPTGPDEAEELDPIAAATLAALAAQAEADADDKKAKVSTVFTDDFELRYWMLDDRLDGFPDRQVLNYVEQVNRFTANVRVNDFSFYAQLDQVALMANTYFLNDERQIERSLLKPGLWSPLIPGVYDPDTQGTQGWDLISRNLYITLEKLRLSWEKDAFSLSLGDSYVAFGRGLALNLNRNVDIDVDSSLQGVRFLWRPGAWDVQGIFGQINRQQVFQDNPNREIFGDRRHTVGGVRVDRYGLGPANIGAHGVVYQFTDTDGWKAGFQELNTAPDVVVGGASVELLGLGPTDWFLEGDVYAFPTDQVFGGGDRKPGYALYLSNSIYAGPTTWFIEGKRYFNTQRMNDLLGPEQYQVAIGPTLEYERAVTEDSGDTLASNDIWGGRIQMDWTAIPATLVPYWALGVYRDNELHFNQAPETIYHPMVGVEWTQDDWAILFNAGYRIDDRDRAADGSDLGMDRQLHGDITAKIPLAKGWYLDLNVGAEYFRWGRNIVQQNDYAEMEAAFTVQKGSDLAFIWYMDFSNNPIINTTGNLTETLYGAGEIQWKPLPALTIKGFFGAYKAGIRCAGGQCRRLPGFEGARVSLQVAF